MSTKIYYSDENSLRDINQRQAKSAIAGAIGAVAAWFGSDYYVSDKMRLFDEEVAQLTRQDIMNRASAGISNIGVGMDASGIGSHVIESAHRLKLINSGNHPFARFVHNLGGKGGFILACTLAVGAAVGGLYYMMTPNKKSEMTQQGSPIFLDEVTQDNPIKSHVDKTITAEDDLKNEIKEELKSEHAQKLQAARREKIKEELKREMGSDSAENSGKWQTKTEQSKGEQMAMAA
jgi:hypothetical protein